MRMQFRGNNYLVGHQNTTIVCHQEHKFIVVKSHPPSSMVKTCGVLNIIFIQLRGLKNQIM